MSDVTDGSKVRKIRALNDAVRTSFTGGKVMLTAAVDALDIGTKAKLFYAIQNFKDWGSDNDPHGEHDFVSVEVDGEQYFGKMSYYDKRLEYGSEDPADEMKTCRVFTIMHHSDY